jgi:hypothetical protein
VVKDIVARVSRKAIKNTKPAKNEENIILNFFSQLCGPPSLLYSVVKSLPSGNIFFFALFTQWLKLCFR